MGLIAVRFACAVLMIWILMGCTSIGSVKFHRAGSDDPLIYGGTRMWLENDNFVFWTQGMWIIGPFYPILYAIPIGDLLFSSVLDSVFLPITIPWALSESISNATISDRFDHIVQERNRKECADKYRAAGNSRCLEVSLKPEDPLETEEGRFAISLNIPSAGNQISIYQQGISSDDYFDQLCKLEAGEFIYKSVENVEGVFQMRLRPKTSYTQGHLYAPEDPYGNWGSGLSPENFSGQFGYSFIEAPFVPSNLYSSTKNERRPGDPKYSRYQTDYSGRYWRVMPKESGNTLKSQYGFTWRGIKRPHDRELGIAGSEVIVLDLKTAEVLGVFRGFAKFEFTPRSRSGTGMGWIKRCPNPSAKATRGLQEEFVIKILKPSHSSSR